MANTKVNVGLTVTSLALGGLTGAALTAGATSDRVRQKAPPAQVRTVIITQTIHRVRREHVRAARAPHAGGGSPPRGGGGVRAVTSGAPAAAALVTHTSGRATSAPAAATYSPAPLSTRSSGQHIPVSSGGGGRATAPAPLRTRTSGAAGAPGAKSPAGSGSAPLRTRASGGGGGHSTEGDSGGGDG